MKRSKRFSRGKPRHWLDWYEGRFGNFEGGPASFVPCQLTEDQIREVNAMTHVENELIDQACGRVLARVAERGWESRTDVFFTTDHGELQGDFGLLYKGPYHVDALMRLPMIWRPAPSAKVAHSEIAEPVGQLDLAPTFCQIAGVPVPDWMQGKPLPIAPGSGRERVITEWDSQFAAIGMHLRSIYRDGYTLTVYEKSTRDYGFDLGRRSAGARAARHDLRTSATTAPKASSTTCAKIRCNGAICGTIPPTRKLKSDLRADLYDNLPPGAKSKAAGRSAGVSGGMEGEITLLNAEPAVGSAPPWAGVTPAPSEKY